MANPLRRRSNDDSTTDVDSGTGTITAGQVKSLYEKALKDVAAEHNEYWLNYAFLRSHQWLFWNPATNRLDEVPRDEDRVQVTINRLLPASRTIISKSVQRQLDFDVPPTAADDATARGAKIADAIIRDKHRESDWESLREDANWSTWRGGYAAIAVEWDAQAGTTIGDVDGKAFGEGNTVETVLSPVEFVVEPGARNYEKARWWIKALVMPPEEAQARYRLPTKPKADATAGMSPHQRKLLAADGRGGSGGQDADKTLVLTYYERPNFLRPQGLICTVIGDKIVEGPVAWYFPFTDHLNFALQRETHDDTRGTGTTVVSAARLVQVAFNASWSSIIEHLKLAGNARLAIPQSSVDLIGTLTDLPAEIITYPDGTTPPDWISPPQMPNWWIEQPTALAAEMDDILGNHAISRGEAPPNIESGYGLSVLSENDSTPIGRLVKESATAWGKVASMVLKLYAVKAIEPRTARVTSAGSPPDTEKWTGEDLMGQTTAIVPVDAVMPRSRAAMQALAERLLQMKAITTVADFAHVAEIPGQADLITAVAPDIAKARRENHLLAQGDAPEPDELVDDHVLHLKEHRDFAKSARYALLPQPIKDVVRTHIQAHITLQGEQAGKQAAAAAIGGQGLAAVTPGPLDPAAAAAGAMPMTPETLGAPGASDQGGPATPVASTPPPESDGPSRLVPPTE